MSDSQNVPVFMRHVDETEPNFLGRFPVSDLEEVVRSVTEAGCFYGDDVTTLATTQYICYRPSPKAKAFVGFEIIVGMND